MLNRREVLFGWAASALSKFAPSSPLDVFPIRDGVPRVDYHVHIGPAVSVDQAVETAKKRAMKFGLLQHAGTKGHGYAVSDDETLTAWVRSLEGKLVFKGIEAETVDWPSAFSKSALAQLDYVQADALGVPDKSGSPLELWKPGFRPDNVQEFMDRYTDFHVQRILSEPIDIFVAPTFLPATLLADYDRLWTPKRMRMVVDAAAKKSVALEIDCNFRVPRLRFLEMVKAAGLKFSFGSNYQTLEGIGDISYCVQMYQRLALTPQHIFRPSRKPLAFNQAGAPPAEPLDRQ